MVPPEKQTPFEKATCAIMACGGVAFNTNNVTELDALDELIQIQKAELDANHHTFDHVKFEELLGKQLKKYPKLLDKIQTDILDCVTFYKESLPGEKWKLAKP